MYSSNPQQPTRGKTSPLTAQSTDFDQDVTPPPQSMLGEDRWIWERHRAKVEMIEQMVRSQEIVTTALLARADRMDQRWDELITTMHQSATQQAINTAILERMEKARGEDGTRARWVISTIIPLLSIAVAVIAIIINTLRNP